MAFLLGCHGTQTTQKNRVVSDNVLRRKNVPFFLFRSLFKQLPSQREGCGCQDSLLQTAVMVLTVQVQCEKAEEIKARQGWHGDMQKQSLEQSTMI